MTPYTWRNFSISTPTARECQMDRLFLHKEHFIYKLSVTRQKTAQKTGKNPIKTCFFHACLKIPAMRNKNFQIEGSLKIEISKMRDSSKWKFPKRGIRNVGSIPHFGNFYFEGSLVLEISILRDPSFQEF